MLCIFGLFLGLGLPVGLLLSIAVPGFGSSPPGHPISFTTAHLCR